MLSRRGFLSALAAPVLAAVLPAPKRPVYRYRQFEILLCHGIDRSRFFDSKTIHPPRHVNYRCVLKLVPTGVEWSGRVVPVNEITYRPVG